MLVGNTLLFAKLRPTAKIPTKDKENAGYDVYADFEEDSIIIAPHHTVMIPTGICSAMSDRYCGILKERGSTGTKGMAQRSGVIDSGYRGEWFVPITNTTNKTLILTKDENAQSNDYYIYYPISKAIAQVIIVPVPDMEIREVTPEKIQQIESKRGMGKLGASGK